MVVAVSHGAQLDQIPADAEIPALRVAFDVFCEGAIVGFQIVQVYLDPHWHVHVVGHFIRSSVLWREDSQQLRRGSSGSSASHTQEPQMAQSNNVTQHPATR